jgi:pilus assembly protein CpaB
MTRIVVSDVVVLTAGTRYDQAKSRDGQPIQTSVVTLLLQPTDAERVILAANQGGLMLTLRNPLDHKQTESKGIRRAALFGDAPPPPVIKTVESGRKVATPAPPPTPPPPPTPKVYTVETYKAAKRAEEVVK